ITRPKALARRRRLRAIGFALVMLVGATLGGGLAAVAAFLSGSVTSSGWDVQALIDRLEERTPRARYVDSSPSRTSGSAASDAKSAGTAALGRFEPAARTGEPVAPSSTAPEHRTTSGSIPPTGSPRGSASGPALRGEPAELEIEPDKTYLRLPGAARGHRIFVDGRVAGHGDKPLTLSCGAHAVKIGSAGEPRVIDLPCGGAFDLD
ncbi:MAG TPA: hypothetical protein VM580_00325, partial [Labilithrix sp.]|nr:hypothetical protein [Labilithrix sp.]